MIRIVGISGSRVKAGNLEALVQTALSQIGHHPDVQGELIPLADKEIHGCNHCNWCLRNQVEGEFCVQQDDMRYIYPRVLEADGLLLASPAHLGRLSGVLANTIDRLRAFVHGNLYKKRMRNKIGGAMAVAFYRGGGIETTLLSINLFFLSMQMIVATSDMYQLGAGAFTSREGKGRFAREPRLMVLEDDYGTQSARMLIDRMVELARIVRAGEAGRSSDL